MIEIKTERADSYFFKFDFTDFKVLSVTSAAKDITLSSNMSRIYINVPYAKKNTQKTQGRLGSFEKSGLQKTISIKTSCATPAHAKSLYIPKVAFSGGRIGRNDFSTVGDEIQWYYKKITI